MQYIGRCHNFVFLPVASNDNDDLLAFSSPSYDLMIVREIKQQMLAENRDSGELLSSRRERRFFQEVLDAERYIVMRYFDHRAKEEAIRALKDYILTNYLCPKSNRRRKSGKLEKTN